MEYLPASASVMLSNGTTFAVIHLSFSGTELTLKKISPTGARSARLIFWASSRNHSGCMEDKKPALYAQAFVLLLLCKNARTHRNSVNFLTAEKDLLRAF
jgi:hypothetical protein